MTIQLTKIEAIKAEYAPYHTMIEFQQGYDDYMNGWSRGDYENVAAQAYDRGRKAARRVKRGCE